MNIQLGRDSLLNKWCWEYQTENMQENHLLTSYTRINSKWIVDSNVRLKTMKTLKKPTWSEISNIYYTNIVFWYIMLGKGNKRKNKQMGLHQIKKFF